MINGIKEELLQERLAMKPEFSIIWPSYILVQDESNPHNGTIGMILTIRTVTPKNGDDYHCLVVKYSDGQDEYVNINAVAGRKKNPKYRLLSSQEVSELKNIKQKAASS